MPVTQHQQQDQEAPGQQGGEPAGHVADLQHVVQHAEGDQTEHGDGERSPGGQGQGDDRGRRACRVTKHRVRGRLTAVDCGRRPWTGASFPIALLLTCVIELPGLPAGVRRRLGWIPARRAGGPAARAGCAAIGLALAVNLITHPVFWHAALRPAGTVGAAAR